MRVGNMELKNRIVMPAMHLNYTPTGEVTDTLIDFYVERAKGEAGFIIIGGCVIDKMSGAQNMVNISDDKYLPGLKRFATAVKAAGAPVGAQLYHAGRYAHSMFIGGQKSLAPSAIASRFTGEEPREMTLAEIRETIEHFAQAAARAKAAGFDAVEVLGSAGYLIAQFLSPITNLRKDEYGGAIENRMKFGLEVADAVREAVGKDFTVLFRLAGNDFMPGSHTNIETRLFARKLEHHGVDALNITGGWHETRVPQLPMNMPRGAFFYLAQGVRSTANVPVVVCNRISDPRLAEELLVQGSGDLVGMGRALIADPMLPVKAREGRFEEINFCVGCNQGCFDRVFLLQPVSCMMNPRAGQEAAMAPKPAAQSKKVLIVGGGPAGLAAAREAAEKGHKVTLAEKEEDLGGQINIAAIPYDRREFATLVDSLACQVRSLGVKIECARKVDEDYVRSLSPDAIIVATGGRPITPPIPGVDGPNVVQAWDVMMGHAEVGEKVLIIGGGAVGCEVALHLAAIGALDPEALHFLFLNKAETPETLYELSTTGTKQVTIIEMLKDIGKDIGRSTRWIVLQDLQRYKIKTRTKTKALEIRADGVLVETGDKQELMECDTVVLAVGTRSDSELYERIKDLAPNVILVGDAKKPRKAFDAIHEGFHAAMQI